MKRVWKITGMAFLGLVGICLLLNIVLFLSGGRFSFTPPVKHKAAFAAQDLSQFPGRLQARGNQIVDQSGQAVVLRGLMPPDPARLRSDGDFNQAFFAWMAEAGADVIRIPVHPECWVRDPDYLWRYLDPVVAWAGESGRYVIIDWHFIGNVATGAGPGCGPAGPDSGLLAADRRLLRRSPQCPLRDLQRAAKHGRGRMAGQRDRDRAGHPRRGSRSAGDRRRDRLWQGSVLVTEWGFMDDNGNPAQSYLAGSQAGYEEPFLGYLRERRIGWVACWYDGGWLPPMFTKGREYLTPYERFVLEQLKETR